MIELKLHWPHSALSPNARLHWRRKAFAVKNARKIAWATTLEQKPAPAPDGPLNLELIFCPPDARRYDRDNLVARMKPALDGISDALKIDDVRFSTLTVKFGEILRPFGAVHIRITGESNG